MSKPEYREGPEARKKFEKGMAKLSKAKKTLAKRRSRLHQNANRVNPARANVYAPSRCRCSMGEGNPVSSL